MQKRRTNKAITERPSQFVGKDPKQELAPIPLLDKGRARGPAFTSIQGPSFHSLKLAPIMGLEISELQRDRIVQHGNDLDLKAASMAADLYMAYHNYCKILKVPTKVFLKEKNNAEKICAILGQMNALIKKRHKDAQVNIEYKEGSFHFVAFQYLNSNQTIYSFPLNFIQHLEDSNKRLAEVFTPFISYVLNKAGFSNWNNWRVDWCIQMMFENANEFEEGDDPQGRLDLLEELKAYEPRGIASRYNSKLHKIPSFNALKKIISSYRPSARTSVALHAWMKEGIEIFSLEGICSVFTLDYDNDGINSEDATPIMPADTHIILWDDDARVVEQFIEIMNQDSSEVGEITPNTWMIIDAKTRKPFIPNLWYNKFIKWYGLLPGIINLLTKNTK